MKYAYFPGCSLKGTGRAFEESILPVFKALDAELVELDDWNCCGATAYMSVDEIKAAALAGRNLALRRELAAQDRRHPTHVLGFVSNMHEIMSVADLTITKPGGLTTAEALALGKPLFILNPIPGQETANSDFLLERGAAAKANRVEDLPFRIDRLLGSPRLTEMAAAARALGRPGAARAICAAVNDALRP